ncbi:hypothetical protein DC498_03330 [Terrimonas sp.]|nr:hypothetical protein DC498_03330 [Terrimonas sp.]
MYQTVQEKGGQIAIKNPVTGQDKLLLYPNELTVDGDMRLTSGREAFTGRVCSVKKFQVWI